MTLAALDARSRVKNRLADLGMTAIALARLVNMPASRINLGLRELGDWSERDARVLLDCTLRLQEIRDSFLPCPLDMSQPEALRILLDRMDEKGKTAADIRQIVAQVLETE